MLCYPPYAVIIVQFTTVWITQGASCAHHRGSGRGVRSLGKSKESLDGAGSSHKEEATRNEEDFLKCNFGGAQ